MISIWSQEITHNKKGKEPHAAKDLIQDHYNLIDNILPKQGWKDLDVDFRDYSTFSMDSNLLLFKCPEQLSFWFVC